MDLSKIIASAAADVKASEDYNQGKEACIRPSRAGLTLIQLVMADVLLPRLPVLVPKWKTKADPYAGTMRLLTGHLFEKVVQAKLEEDNTSGELLILPQHTLTLDGMTGSCDFIVLNKREQKLQVIECKAPKAYSVQEVREQKLFCDNYGYLTQLAIYTLAAKEMYPEYEVSSIWYVWIKQLERHTKVPFPLDDTELTEIRNEVKLKTREYNEFKQQFEAGEIEKAAELLLQRTEDLPERIFNNGYLQGTCDMHFNPYAQLLLQENGTLLDNCIGNLIQLIHAAKTGDTGNIQSLIKL